MMRDSPIGKLRHGKRATLVGDMSGLIPLLHLCTTLGRDMRQVMRLQMNSADVHRRTNLQTQWPNH